MNYIATDRGMEAESTYRETCKKCRGQGRFISWTGRVVGQCFTCKGVGHKEFKTAPEERAQNRQRAAERRVMGATENVVTFAQQYPEVARWIGEAAGRGFEFAQSLQATIIRRGELSESQIAAAERCMARDAERNKVREEARAIREAAAPAISTDRLMAAFDQAREQGLKRLKMRFIGFEASPAPAHGNNPGAIYVKDGEQYLGKIKDGKFYASRDCGPEVAQRVAQAMNDPLAEAVAYGRQTGSCCCCGRELTDPASIEAGIGPICAGKFGL